MSKTFHPWKIDEPPFPPLTVRDKTGEEMPDWVADKQRRAEKIRQAKVALESQARLS